MYALPWSYRAWPREKRSACGVFLVFKRCLHSCVLSSMSLSSPGHQTWLRAAAFMRVTLVAHIESAPVRREVWWFPSPTHSRKIHQVLFVLFIVLLVWWIFYSDFCFLLLTMQTRRVSITPLFQVQELGLTVSTGRLRCSWPYLISPTKKFQRICRTIAFDEICVLVVLNKDIGSII